ncbi:UNVERIFIED_ORG: putative membrane protein [Variovorax guangxiensis]
MNTYLVLKWLHIVSSVLMVGTGLGSAFYMFFANRSGSVPAQAVVSRLVVRADWWFTTPTVILQPATGFALAHMAGFPLSTPWLALSLALFVFAGACWLPVVWLQIRMAAIAAQAHRNAAPLPPLYARYQRWWELLGYPAFAVMVVVFYLMVTKPQL